MWRVGLLTSFAKLLLIKKNQQQDVFVTGLQGMLPTIRHMIPRVKGLV